MVQQLNVDVSMEGRRQQLKASELGKVVMFLFKLPDETPANRRLAKDLVYKWSRPIFDESRDQADDEARHDREMGLAKARQARQAQASTTPAGGCANQSGDLSVRPWSQCPLGGGGMWTGLNEVGAKLGLAQVSASRCRRIVQPACCWEPACI